MSVPEYDLRPLSDIFSMCKVTRKVVECSGRITGFRWLEVFKMIPDSRFDVQKKLRDIYAEVGLKVQAPLFWLFVPQLISESRRRLLRWVYREDIPAGRDELSISWLNEAFLDRMPCKPQIELNDLWGQLLWTGQVDLLVKFLDHIDSLYLCKQYSTRCEYAQHYSNHWKRPDQNFRHIAYPIPPPDPNSSNLPEFGVIPVPVAQQAPLVPASVGYSYPGYQQQPSGYPQAPPGYGNQYPYQPPMGYGTHPQQQGGPQMVMSMTPGGGIEPQMIMGGGGGTLGGQGAAGGGFGGSGPIAVNVGGKNSAEPDDDDQLDLNHDHSEAEVDVHDESANAVPKVRKTMNRQAPVTVRSVQQPATGSGEMTGKALSTSEQQLSSPVQSNLNSDVGVAAKADKEKATSVTKDGQSKDAD